MRSPAISTISAVGPAARSVHRQRASDDHGDDAHHPVDGIRGAQQGRDEQADQYEETNGSGHDERAIEPMCVLRGSPWRSLRSMCVRYPSPGPGWIVAGVDRQVIANVSQLLLVRTCRVVRRVGGERAKGVRREGRGELPVRRGRCRRRRRIAVGLARCEARNVPRPVAIAVGVTVTAAVAGNALISKDDLAWLYGLRVPRMQLPLARFAAVGVVYHLLLGCVLYRAADRRDRTATRLALAVLVLNEVWNVGFFGRRSVRTGFFVDMVFLVLLYGAGRSRWRRTGVPACCWPLHGLGDLLRRALDAAVVAAQPTAAGAAEGR